MTLIAPLPGQVFQTVVDFGNDPDDDYDATSDRFETTDITEAQVTTSMVAGDRGADRNLHKVVIDLDLPAKLLPSSTEGHFHLYIDHEIPWTKYRNLLRALAEAGLIEPGYLGASEDRGYTAVRLPWVKKEAVAA